MSETAGAANAVIEYYFTVTIKRKLEKSSDKKCSYVTDFSLAASATRARIKAGSYKEGKCEKP